jgi:hypothetical protein
MRRTVLATEVASAGLVVSLAVDGGRSPVSPRHGIAAGKKALTRSEKSHRACTARHLATPQQFAQRIALDLCFIYTYTEK